MEQTSLGKRRWESLQEIAAPLSEIRKIVTHFSKKKSKTVAPEDETLLEQGMIEFLELKSANISAHKETERKKVETQGKKQQVDVTNLELSNLNYEKNHFVKQIRNCRDLELTYEKIDLVPEEEFKKTAPENLRVLYKPDKHQMMLNRLTFELEERKRLSAELDDLKTKKKAIIDANEAKTNFMSSLLSKLKGLEEATVPIQKHLGVNTTRTAAEYTNANHLPSPLYALYLQAVAFRDALKETTVSVHIDGDVDAAIALLKVEREVEEDAKEEEEDDTSRRKSTKDQNSKEKSFKDTHPLSMRVKVSSTGGEKKSTIVLRFMFMTQLNVLTVESTWAHDSSSAAKLLVNLFPDDPGTCSPNPDNAQLLPSQSLVWDKKLPGQPFKWVQWLGGLGAIIKPQEGQFRCAMARVAARIASHMMLQKELKALGKKNLLITEKQTASLFQMAPTASIVKWSQVEDAQVDEPDTKVFELTLQRGDYKLRACVTLTPDYPVQPPRVQLAFVAHPQPKPHAAVPGIKLDPVAEKLAIEGEPTNNNLEAIEKEINVHFDDLLVTTGEAGAYNLLSLQLRRLQMCFDIYVATELDERKKGGRICFKPERGRARKKPFEYNSGTGLFDQRR